MVAKGVFTNVKIEKKHCHVKFDSKSLVEIHDLYFFFQYMYTHFDTLNTNIMHILKDVLKFTNLAST